MIVIEGLTKVYGDGRGRSVVLDGISLTIDDGEIFAVVGPSGAGKSTLAHCVNFLEKPSSGSIRVGGVELAGLTEPQLRVARRKIGTIFQHDGLSSRRTAAANIELPLSYLGVTKHEARARVGELLHQVGLSEKGKHYPHQLSGGQRQRVGIARALALRPSVLLADEATSGLDPDSTASIVALIKRLRDELALSVLFITHEMDTVLRVADTVARLDRGRIRESGALASLLRDPRSELGRLLRPLPQLGLDASGQDVWTLTYTSQSVPTDWVSRLSRALSVPVSLLAASIEHVGGALVGTATVGLDASVREGVPGAAATLALDAQLARSARGASTRTAASDESIDEEEAA